MIQCDGDIEKCKRASTFDRHPFIESVRPKPWPSGEHQRIRSAGYLSTLSKQKTAMQFAMKFKYSITKQSRFSSSHYLLKTPILF